MNDKMPENKNTKIGTNEPAVSKNEELVLPKGALIAFRKSGGLKFSSREIIIYPDGRISYSDVDLSQEARQHSARKLNDGQIARLRRTLEQSNFFRTASSEAKQPPDGFAYEVIARTGNRVNRVEVFDGGIPDALTPLIQQLSGLLPKDSG